MRRSAGFTYLALLWWVAISSMMLAALAQQWGIESRRQREMELVFRGEQIKAALVSFQRNTPDGQIGLPARLDDLLEDRRGPVIKRHLRKLWKDPITGGPWGVISHAGFVVGVYSTSARAPLRAPADVKTYEDWRFEIAPPPPRASGALSG